MTPATSYPWQSGIAITCGESKNCSRPALIVPSRRVVEWSRESWSGLGSQAGAEIFVCGALLSLRLFFLLLSGIFWILSHSQHFPVRWTLVALLHLVHKESTSVSPTGVGALGLPSQPRGSENWSWAKAARASQVVLVVKNPPDKAGDTGDAGSITGLARSPVGRNGSLHQYSCLENPMDREAWWATIHGAAKSWTWLNVWAQRQLCCAWHKWVLFRVSDKKCYFSWFVSLIPTWGNFRVTRLGFLDQEKI